MKRTWWKEAVGYEIYPKTFYDSNGDGIGDLPGIIQKLDYLADLGVNLLWICPFFKSPMDDNGYDVADYLSVDPSFGTNEDFKRLLSEAHSRGIKVIIDFVLNHTSDEHQWFIEGRKNRYSKQRQYYIWKDPKYDEYGAILPPNNWGSFFSESAWSYDEAAKQYYMHIFSKKMPDLNWENASLRQEMYKIAKYWLDAGVDGFRLDAIAHLAKDLSFASSLQTPNIEGYTLDPSKFSSIPRLFDYLKEFKDQVLIKYPRIMTIGEVGGSASTGEALKYSNYKDGFLNMVFNFDTCWENGAYGSDEKLDYQIVTDVKNLKTLFKKWYDACRGKAWLPIYWGNHDHPRVVSQYGSVRYRDESAKMLATTLLFMYGTPFLYNGEEIGMSNVDYTRITDFKDVSALNYARKASNRLNEDQILRFLRRTSRINARTPMQWEDAPHGGFTTGTPMQKVNGNYPSVNVASEQNDANSILNFYKAAIALRKDPLILEAVLDAPFELVEPDHKDVFAYLHQGDHIAVLVISNFRSYEVPFKLGYRVKKILLHNYPTMEKRGLSLQLRPFESYLLELDLG
ncbi:MAG TPA: glucohydrolase [Firmicutes bacterium]|nr:glucohydrolase [Bacillota bacterium]